MHRRTDRRGPTIETGDAATAAGFARACDRALALARAGTLPPGDAAVPALAALVLGDPEPATTLLDAWAAGRAETQAADGGSGIVPLPLLAARHLAWTGDAALARRVWPRARELRDQASRVAGAAGADPGRTAVMGGVLRELGALAEAAGDRPTGAAMEAEARALLRAVRASPPDPASAEHVVAAALGAYDPDPPAGSSPADASAGSGMSLSDAAFRCMQVWAAMVSGRTDAAMQWAGILAWLDRESARTAATPDEPPDLIGKAAALAILAGVFGLVGAAPDAPKGRLRLRPHLPAAWELLDVRDLTVGDASFDLRVRRQDGRRSYLIEQTAGAVPATIILEMLVPGPSVRRIDVDGRPAALDVRAFGPASLIPVQLVADDVRTVTLAGEDL